MATPGFKRLKTGEHGGLSSMAYVPKHKMTGCKGVIDTNN